MHGSESRIAVVIPSYRVSRHILDVIASVGPMVSQIIVVDDACPDGSGALVKAQCRDERVVVLMHDVNQGVGGAALTGYRHAIDSGADIIVKVDGDGQMDLRLLPRFVRPIADGLADYTKGNRFYDLSQIGQMPLVRLVGNAVLSFMAKFSSGYWDVFDPTNGYTAISARVATLLPMDKISKRYFFETDMLFRLGTFRAVILDVPMDAKYADEVSNLRITRVLGEFLSKHVRNFCKRIFYNYFLRDLSIASLELIAGLILLSFGVGFGAMEWWKGIANGVPTTAGTVMLAAMPILVGLQLLLAFFSYDIAAVPRQPLSCRLVDGSERVGEDEAPGC